VSLVNKFVIRDHLVTDFNKVRRGRGEGVEKGFQGLRRLVCIRAEKKYIGTPLRRQLIVGLIILFQVFFQISHSLCYQMG
jgi:hypothetical protein